MFSARYHAVLRLPTYNCHLKSMQLAWNKQEHSIGQRSSDVTNTILAELVLGSENSNFAYAVFISYYNYAVIMTALLLITFSAQLRLIEGSEI